MNSLDRIINTIDGNWPILTEPKDNDISNVNLISSSQQNSDASNQNNDHHDIITEHLLAEAHRKLESNELPMEQRIELRNHIDKLMAINNINEVPPKRQRVEDNVPHNNLSISNNNNNHSAPPSISLNNNPQPMLWKTEIEGYKMPNIGIDPRLLNFCYPIRVNNFLNVELNGCVQQLFMERLQPLIFYNGAYHAARFKTTEISVMIDNRSYKIPGNGYTTVFIRNRPYTACLGGPGHELILDGKAYSVPFRNNGSIINFNNNNLGVRFLLPFPLDIIYLPPIPDEIMAFSKKGYFGSAVYLAKSPKNPLTPSENMKKYEKLPDSKDIYQRLVKAGLVKSTFNLNDLDIMKFSLDKFKSVNTTIADRLLFGYQCVQCGLRFESDNCATYTAHLDYHYIKNANEHKNIRHRNANPQGAIWIIGESTEENKSESEMNDVDFEEEYSCIAFSDDSKNKCDVCNEGFDAFFNDDEEEWMLKNSVHSNGKVYHPVCLEDAGKVFESNDIITVKLPETLSRLFNSQ